MNSAQFLASHITSLEIRQLAFPEAVEALRQAVATEEWDAAEVAVVRHSIPASSETYPQRADSEFLVTVRLRECSVHEALMTLCVSCGFELDVKHSRLTCFEVSSPSSAPGFERMTGNEPPPAHVLKALRLKAFQAPGLSVLDALEKAQKLAQEATQLRLPTPALVQHRDRETGHMEKSLPDSIGVRLDMKNAPYTDVIRYISELAGCTYQLLPNGQIIVTRVSALYHPRHLRVFPAAAFSDRLAVPLHELNEKMLQDWFAEKVWLDVPVEFRLSGKMPRFAAVPFLHRSSAKVYIFYLSPEEESKLVSLLSEKRKK